MIKIFFKKFSLAILATFVVVLSLTSYYFYKKANSDVNTINQKEITDVVDKVDKLIVLPKGETPTLATVTNIEALNGQLFFADAQLGDKVLMYTNAKKAILYNPSIDKVVNIAPIDTSAPSSQTQVNQTPTIAAPIIQKSSSKNFTAITNTKKKK